MVYIGPNTQSLNYTHMFGTPELRGKTLPFEKDDKILINNDTGFYAGKNTIIGQIYLHSDFSHFKYILEKSGLQEVYGDNHTNFTIFVPSDNAIKDKYDENFFVSIDKFIARKIVRGLTLRRKIPSSVLNDSPASCFKNIDNERLLVENKDDRIKINGSINVIHKDWMCGNGIIHVIDSFNM